MMHMGSLCWFYKWGDRGTEKEIKQNVMEDREPEMEKEKLSGFY